MTPDETKLTVAAISQASYGRLLYLRHVQQIMTPEDERDLARLTQWWNNLGEDNQNKILKWQKDFSRDTEDISAVSGRQAIKRVSEWGPAQ